MAKWKVETSSGGMVELDLDKITEVTQNGNVLADGTKHSLKEAECVRIAKYIARQKARVEVEEKKEQCARLSSAGRQQRLRVEAGMPLVGVVRTFDLREDVFDAARNSSVNATSFDTYEAAMREANPTARGIDCGIKKADRRSAFSRQGFQRVLRNFFQLRSSRLATRRSSHSLARFERFRLARGGISSGTITCARRFSFRVFGCRK